MKIIRKLDDLLKWVQNWILVITGTAVGIMIIVNAAFRFLAIDWFGSEELTLFVAFWLYFMGAACASREGTHICADMIALFTDNVKILSVVGVIKNLVGLAMSVTFTVWCAQYVAWQAGLGAKSVVYKLPVIISTIPILICFVLWSLYLLRDLIISARSFTAKKEASDMEGGN